MFDDLFSSLRYKIKNFQHSVEPSSRKPRQSPPVRMAQNFLVIWLDASIEETNNEDCHKSITELRQMVNTVITHQFRGIRITAFFIPCSIEHYAPWKQNSSLRWASSFEISPHSIKNSTVDKATAARLPSITIKVCLKQTLTN